MSKINDGRRPMHMSVLESEIFQFLGQLPPVYSVSAEKPLLLVEGDSDGAFRYQPDFEVRRTDGRYVLIEVKSEYAMSLSNMVRFSEIDKVVRKNSGAGFLILIAGSQGFMPKFIERPEFQHLHVVYAKSPTQVIRAVEKEFEGLRVE